MAEHIRMHLDVRDQWPTDVPIGTFELMRSTLQGRPSVSGHILFVCPNGKRCAVFVGPAFEQRRNENEPCVWAWDGNTEKPTLTPSINCLTEKDGKPCGACFEIPVDKLMEFKGTECRCRFCGTSFLFLNPNDQAATTSPFYHLAVALDYIKGVKDRVEVEFAIPIKD